MKRVVRIAISHIRERSVAELSLSACGLAALLYLLLNWWFVDNRANHAGHLAALAATGLFAVFGLKCSHTLIESLTGTEPPGRELPKEEHVPERRVFLRFFLTGCAFLALCAAGRLLLEGTDEPISLERLLRMSDSSCYLEIARFWYAPTEEVWEGRLVFLPLFPLLLRLLHAVTGEYYLTGLLINTALYAASGVLLYRLLLLDFPEAQSRCALKYLALLPGCFFMVGLLSESMFFFCTLTSYYCARKKYWFRAGLFGALSSFSRSLGVLVLVPLLAEALAGCFRPGRRFGRPELKAMLCSCMTPLGLLTYMGINARYYGDPLYFLTLEKELWDQSMGSFIHTLSRQTDTALFCLRMPYWQVSLGLWIPNALAGFASLLLFACVAHRLRASLGLWFLAYYFVAVSPTYLLSAPRYLVAAVPIYPALAQLAASRKRERCVAVLSTLCAALYFVAFLLGWEVY